LRCRLGCRGTCPRSCSICRSWQTLRCPAKCIMCHNNKLSLGTNSADDMQPDAACG
jgi:hypothetical protein